MKKRIKKIIAAIKKLKVKEVNRALKEKSEKQDNAEQNYFKKAKSWADDIYTATIISRNRYKLAFFGVLGLSSVLVFCILILVFKQHTELVIVHEGTSGYNWISMAKVNEKTNISWTRTQAEIARYVRARESYDPLLYSYQTKEVSFFNAPQVQAEYQIEQSGDNSLSPINLLGAKGYRTVLVHNVLLLDSDIKNKKGKGRHVNLAQVNYMLVDHFFGQGKTVKIPYTALISWRYDGVPADVTKMMRNWDGFVVTKFVSQPMILDK